MTASTLRRHSPWALALVPLALAACGSGSGAGSGAVSTNASTSTSETSLSASELKAADTAVSAGLTSYLSKAKACKDQSSPVVCVESADRTLGGQVHDYANKLAAGSGFGSRTADVTAARNSAQLLANSMEILGDAQPTQANYDQVLNTFNVAASIAAVQKAVAKVQSDLG